MLVQANGVEINVEVSGPAGAPVVALGHSLGSSGRMWAPQLPELEKRWRVVNIDMRGHGRSAAPKGPYSFDDLAGDALGALDALGVKQAHWVGLSIGGMIGQALALKAPERFLSFTLCATTSRIPPEMRPIWDERVAKVRKGGMAALWDETAARWFTAPYLAKNPPGVAMIRGEFLNTSIEGYAGCSAAIQTLNFIDRLGEIRKPILVLCGALDPSTPPAASEAIHQRIAGSKLIVVPDAMHIFNVEKAEETTRALVDFLGSVR
jgi:3-oxoadipate enol-lactonase